MVAGTASGWFSGNRRIPDSIQGETAEVLGHRDRTTTMGYACPVCEVPQRDGEHLANHLAFTAMLREDDHEAWLDEHVPGWGGETPAELAGRVTERAEEAEYDEVFEDTTGGDHDHEHRGHDHGEHVRDRAVGQDPTGGFAGMAQGIADEAVESVLREAREMTAEMYGTERDDADADDTGTVDGDELGGDAGTDDDHEGAEPDADDREGNDS